MIRVSVPGRGECIYTDKSNIRIRIYWVGTANSAWENIANWSYGQVPDQYTDVIISAAVPNYPVVNSNDSIRGLIMDPAVTVTLVSGKALNIKGK